VNSGLIGGIIGSAIGVLGGIVGTYFGLKNTNGPRERSYMKKLAVAVWVAVTGFVVATLWLPPRYKQYLLAIYVLALPVAIVWGNRRQRTIRGQEAITTDTTR
jgi:Ca2+/Na+ antiporter